MDPSPSAPTAPRHRAAPGPLPGLPLADPGFDRGCGRRVDDAWLPGLLEDPAARVLVLCGGRAPVREGRLALLPADVAPRGATPVYLGRAGDTEVVLADVAHPPSAWPGDDDGGAPEWLGLRDVAAGLPAADAGLFTAAAAVAAWHATHTHCPRCGAPTRAAQSGWVRVCTRDGTEHFPRTDPAIIVAVTDDDDRLLLGANAAWGGHRFSTLAGFVEPGESLEAAVVREVGEEAGIAVAEPRYAGSQPWPFPRSLMLGFFARATGTETEPDGQEIVALRWFTRDRLAEESAAGTIALPGATSIARHLIDAWYGGPVPEPARLEN